MTAHSKIIILSKSSNYSKFLNTGFKLFDLTELTRRSRLYFYSCLMETPFWDTCIYIFYMSDQSNLISGQQSDIDKTSFTIEKFIKLFRFLYIKWTIIKSMTRKKRNLILSEFGKNSTLVSAILFSKYFFFVKMDN